MNNLAIVIFSADINDDLWDIDNILLKRYWHFRPRTYLLTETKKYKKFKTINFNYPIEQWTKRIRESLKQIKENYIIFMCDDVFIQSKVNKKLLKEIFTFMKNNQSIANINFELSFDRNNIDCENEYLKYRRNGSITKVSLLCGLWDKEKLISLLDKDCSPWDIEKSQNDKGYKYYQLKNQKIISWLNDGPFLCGGIYQGKWHHNTLDFLKKEKINITKLHKREEVQ